MNKLLRYSFVAILAMIVGSAWADEVTMKYSGTETSNMLADGSNEAATVGLDASAWSVVADKGSASNAPGLNKAGDIRLYYNASGSNTIEVKSLANATINKIALTFTDAQYSNVSVTVNGSAVTGTDGVFEINASSFVLGNGNTSNVQVRISQIVISYGGGTPIAVQPPKFSVAGGTYYEPQTVAMSCETEGAKILYTIPAGDDPVYTDDNNYSGVFYDGNPLTISRTTTIKAMAVKDGKTSSIVSATYTIKEIEEINVAKALEIINGLENGKTTADVYKVKGFVVGTPDFQRDKEEKLYGNVNFMMADEKGGTTTLTVFRAKDFENVNFTEETINRIKDGDAVVLQGKLQKYVKDEVVTPELTNGYLISVDAGSATTTTYKITVYNTEHGNITLDKYEAAAGEKVNVIGMSVDEGYEMNEPTIVAANGNVVEPGGSDEEGHYIIMPASDVMIFLNISKLYLITVNFDSSMGDVRGISFDSEKSPIYKSAGKNVKFTVTPKEGYKVESVTAADEDKNPITVNIAADLSYYEFEMPANNVTITALFSSSVADTWTVAGTPPLTYNGWDPSDTNCDMTPNGNGEGVSSYERDNIVLEKGVSYECKVVKNHSWDENYPAENYVITVVETAKYHVKIFFNTTTHEITHEIAKMGEVDPIEDTWTVAGTIPLTDAEWAPSDTSGDMLPNGNGEGVSSYERNDIVLEAGKNYEFKVVKNHSWAEAYPAENYVITVAETAKYHVKIFFNTKTHEIFHEIQKTGEAGPITHTWSVIGTLVGNWDVDTEMTKGEDGLYKAEFENVAKGNYEFKVRADKLWTTAYPDKNYELNVEKDGSNVTVTFDEAKAEVKAIVSMPISQNIVYDFTSWKTSTVSALVADAAASKTSGWSDVEKAADAEAGADPTEASKNNCFWCVAEPNEDGTLSANGEVIEELKGLKWNKAYTVKRSLAIAVNYPTALSDYAGPAYLWLGGGKNKIPCFTIPGVKAGSTVTMEVESHKTSDARGVELYTGVDADGLVDAATKIGDSFTPTTKDSHTWTIDADCDVIVYNTNGCHIYSIKVEAGSTGISTVNAQKTQNNVIYNLAGQKVGNDYKGIVIMNGKKFMQK